MSFVDEVRKISSECNCSYKPFSQVNFFKNDPRFGSGLCAGVTLSWIEAKFKIKNFLDDNVLDKDLIIERNLANYVARSHIDGFIFTESLNKDGEVKSHYFAMSSGNPPRKTGVFISRIFS
ncbi:hypothetical protein ACX1HO_22425 [Yersinia enterocolitica]|uniref:hypothetical protein n=1 Tax=Yersinia enterocolitica TaxID=630 RepID=UPI003F45C544